MEDVIPRGWMDTLTEDWPSQSESFLVSSQPVRRSIRLVRQPILRLRTLVTDAATNLSDI